MLPFSRSKTLASSIVVALLFLLTAASSGAAQSGDPNFPAPVFSNEITGRIAPRDIGDARRTRHFYTFRGTEGDVLVTLDTTELVGDVDVFAANGLRPLMKITLFGDALRATKSFYIRKEEMLILRVEARAVGDAEGTYRITFGGSFAPASADLANAPPPEAPAVSSAEGRGGKVRRVTSTGARIEESPKPAPTPVEAAKESEAEPVPAPATESAGRQPSPAPRRGRGARPTSSSRTRGGATKPQPTAGEAKAETSGTAKTETAEEKSETEKPEATPARKTPAPRRRGARARNARSEGAGESDTSAHSSGSQPSSEAQPPQRLRVITKDGEMIERDMTDVRRVTVENNQLVIVTIDGKVVRKPMTNVLSMTIGP